jgi:hypothetical protein
MDKNIERLNCSSFRAWQIPGLLMLCLLVWGCGAKRVVTPPPPVADMSWTERAIGAEELEALAEQDPDLTSAACLEILARLNKKDRAYIKSDIKKGKPLKVPNDFRSYLTWTPLPVRIPQAGKARKFILVVKDIPFLGWYEKGKLAGDTHICIGKKNGWTKAGLYRVTEKDVDHVSQSYRSAYGYPALMPYALRIYGHVWIHGGDIVGGYCSHGCINLPLSTAEELFTWTDTGTIVLVVESLKDLNRTLDKHSKLIVLS